MNRRAVLKGAALSGAGFVLVGGGAVGWRATEAGLLDAEATPFEPWRALEEVPPGDRRGLAAAAILASSPHNTQPWRLTVSPERFSIAADASRNLGAFDPFRREMWIGLGAAIANAEIAAPAFGFETGPLAIEAWGSEGAGQVVCDLHRGAVEPSPLFAMLPHRRTNRAPYATDPVPDAVLQRVIEQVGSVPDAHLRVFVRETHLGQVFADSTLAATEAINADRQMSHDGHLWFRENAREVARHCDGVSVPTAGLSPAMSVIGQLMPKPDAATSGRYWLASTERQVTETAGFGVIVVDALDDRSGQVAAGRLWQRLHLAFTAEGLAAQPMNQVPEMVDRDRQLERNGPWMGRASVFSEGQGAVTFGFRYGYPTRDVPHSARRSLQNLWS